MPLATIWRDPKLVDDETAARIRDLVKYAVAKALKVSPDEVELRVRNVESLDQNYKPIGIEIDTGAGKWWWRIRQRKQIAT